MFKYSFDSTLTILDSSRFSFKKIKIKDFFDEILHPLNDKYMSCTWEQVKQKKHFHEIDINKLDNKTILKAGENKVYQIAVKGEGRVCGIIIKETFIIISYDKNHNIYNQS
jgi:hypothetical protein